MSERSVNKLTLVGRTGDVPEVRTTPTGVKVAKVSLATSREWSDRNGQKQERTEWHRLVFWDKLADIAERYIGKGERLYIEGQVEYSQTEGDDGVTRYWTDVRVREMVMLSGNGNEQATPTDSHRVTEADTPGAGLKPWDEPDDIFA